MSEISYNEAERLATVGKYADAERMAKRLLKAFPGNFSLQYLLSSINLLTGRYEASRLICQSLLSNPGVNADVYNTLAAISTDFDGDMKQAEIWLKKALAFDSGHRKTLVNLGNHYLRLHRVKEARACFEDATSPSHPHIEALNGLGMLEMTEGNLDKAATLFEYILKQAPDDIWALSHLLETKARANKIEEALEIAIRISRLEHPAIAAIPAYSVAKLYCIWDLADKLMPQALRELNKAPKLFTMFLLANLPLLTTHGFGNNKLLNLHRSVAHVFRRLCDQPPFTEYPVAFSPAKRIRIGYFSADFRNHVVTRFFRSLVTYRDRSKFEIFLYSSAYKKQEDNVTASYIKAADHFIRLPEMSDKEVADRIHADGIHILIELGGYTAGARIEVLVYRPAPVQISYLGYPFSYGLEEVDYVISDPWLDGPKNSLAFVEKMLRLPESFITVEELPQHKIKLTIPAMRNGYVTFGSMNNIYKLNAPTIAIWSRILQRVPDSKMYLNHPNFKNEASREHVVKTFAMYGISADRVVIVYRPHPDGGAHVLYYNEIDIALDTLPLTGGTTTVEALWMGVPVVTLVGDAHAQRLSYSIIKNCGMNLDDCISFNEDTYVENAVMLAANPQRIADIRQHVPTAMRNSILGDPVRFTAHMEAAYIEAWDRKFPETPIAKLINHEVTTSLPIGNSDSLVLNNAPDEVHASVPSLSLMQNESIVLAQYSNEQLISLYNNRQYAAAEEMAKSLIKTAPHDVFVWKVLGVLYAQQEKYVEAERTFFKASELAPEDADIYCNLGNVMQAQEMHDAAIAIFQRAIELNPQHIEAYFNLGNAYKETRRFDEAISCYQQALVLKPDFAEALCNLGIACDKNGRPLEAVSYYRKALDIKPDFEEANYNLGIAYEKSEKFDDAIASYRKAILLNPERSELYFSLGSALERAGDFEHAKDAYIENVNHDPESYKALSRLGLVYIELREPLLALANLSNCLTIKPDYVEAHNHLGIHFDRAGYPDMAIASYKKAIELAPDYSQPYNNMGNVLKDVGDLEDAIASYRQAIKVDPGYYLAYSNLLFCANYHPDYSSEEIYAFYKDYEERFARSLYSEWQPHTNDRDPKRRLKIGYYSPALYRHSCGFFLEPLLAHHDHTQFEIYAYAQIARDDDVTARYRSYADHWIPTRGMSDAALADRIRADGIDILVDVAGHTGENRLLTFARKPAPVSLHWLDFGYTTGLTAIDYYLTDVPTIPPGAEAYFAEQPWRLPTPAYAYRPAEGMGEVNALPALSKGHITFGTLTRAVRLNHKVIRSWTEILKAVPDAHLIINSGNFKSQEMQERIAEQFAAQGIGRERLEIGANSPPWDVLRQIDIGLDCYPHNSGTTLFEHLYMGNPFVTLANRPSVGRLGASILTGAGHPEWIAETEAEYINKAVALAEDLPALSQIRSQLRQQLQHSPLMDEAGFTQAVEQAYRQMWQQWCGLD